MPVVAGDAHRAHDPPYEVNYGEVVRPVYERVERAERIRDALAAAGHPLVEPAAHGIEPLLAVHEPALLRFLERAWAAWRADGGPEVLIPDSFPIPRLARGGGRDLGGGVGPAGLVLLRHRHPDGRRELHGRAGRRRRRPDRGRPGRRRGPGRLRPLPAPRPPRRPRLLRRLLPPQQRRHRGQVAGHRLGRVAVVDVDFHHGNGTQDVFWEDPEVLYVSLHGDPAGHYPHFTGAADETGGGPGRGTNRNLPLPDGTGDDAYLAALGEAMDRGGRLRPGDPGRVGRLRHLRRRPDRRLPGDHRAGSGASGPPWPRPAARPWSCRRAATPSRPSGPTRSPCCGGSRRPSERSYPPTRSFARYVLTTASQASRLALLRLTAAGCAKVGHVGGQPARQGFESPHPDLAGPATARPPGGLSPARRGARPGRRRAGGAGRSSARGR